MKSYIFGMSLISYILGKMYNNSLFKCHVLHFMDSNEYHIDLKILLGFHNIYGQLKDAPSQFYTLSVQKRLTLFYGSVGRQHPCCIRAPKCDLGILELSALRNQPLLRTDFGLILPFD